VRWKGRRQSANIEDRRGQRRGGTAVLGGGIGTVIIVLLFVLLGGDPKEILSLVDATSTSQSTSVGEQGPGNDETRQFVSTVLGDTEDVWTQEFAARGGRYHEPRLVLYSGVTQMPGGMASAATGPFYLPTDQTVYLDFSFFDEMAQRFGAPGDFAAAYVIAHEVGHHVQHQLGITDKVHAQQGRISPAEYNRLSVRLELQADFLAGVWAHHAQKQWNILEEGDIEEAIRAATAIGDDRLQHQSQGCVVPDAFTHGTSEQRVKWFTRGYKSGRIEDGDTFSIPYGQL
jgi:predicted metalloprotease